MKTILSFEIAFEYNIQDTVEKMETVPETTAIATAMDNMTAVYEPQEGEKKAIFNNFNFEFRPIGSHPAWRRTPSNWSSPYALHR